MTNWIFIATLFLLTTNSYGLVTVRDTVVCPIDDHQFIYDKIVAYSTHGIKYDYQRRGLMLTIFIIVFTCPVLNANILVIEQTSIRN